MSVRERASATTAPNIPIEVPSVELRELCRRYQVQELSLFGSALRDDFRSDSDLDFLVLFKPEADVGYFEFTGLQFDLEDLFGRRVDLVPKGGLKPLIKDDVISSARVLYAAE